MAEDMIVGLCDENVGEVARVVMGEKTLVHKVEACQFVSECMSALRIHTDKIECFVRLCDVVVSNSSKEFDASNIRHFLWVNLTNAIRYMTVESGTFELRVLWLAHRLGIFSNKEILGFLMRLQESVRTNLASVCVYMYFLNIIPDNYENPSWMRSVLGVQLPDMLVPVYHRLGRGMLLAPPNIADEAYAYHGRLAAGITSENELRDIIKRDDVAALSARSASPNFDFNQRINPSLFEPNSILQSNPTLGQVAAFFGAVNCFKFLCDVDINLSLLDSKFRTIAQYACYGGNIEILSIIEKECTLANCLEAATRSHNNDVFLWLIEANGLVPGPHECCVACEADNELVVQYCLDHDVCSVNYTNDDGRSLLHIATLNNSVRVVKLLLSDPNIDVNMKATSLVAGIDSDGPPVHFAAMAESVSTLALLLQDSRTDVNALDKVLF